MNHIKFRLWQKFVLAMTLIIMAFLLIECIIIIVLFRLNVDLSHNIVLVLAIVSMSLAGLLTFIASLIFLRPIDKINDAMLQVASGDFSVRLEEKSFLRNIEIMNSSFNTMAKELNSTEMLKSDFISNVSHEFKTPLASIEGYASLLSATELNDEQRGYASNIIESVSRLNTLTGNILRLSRLENQQFHQEKHRFSLDEQIRQAILLLEPSWSEKRLNLEPELESVDFYGYEDLLPQVWINLIANAVKFTPKNGTISFDLHRDKDGVTVSVSDTGIGMNEEEQLHAFDKFYQADNNHSVSGNGLGLPLVKQIVEIHGGTVKIKSAPGNGSTFTVFLPQ